jgi:hypothetical protein
LIYANPSFEDVGVIKDFTLDLAYGIDENDFEITTALQRPLIYDETTGDNVPGYYIYIDGTEYGGVIDGVKANTESNELKYVGRTWNGILATKIIEPDPNEDYYIVSGYADEIVADLIERCDLDDIFTVDIQSELQEEDRVEVITDFKFRYDDLNSGIFWMLQENDGKLKMECRNGKVHLSVERLMNYAAQEEFESSQVQFDMAQTYANCNHLICLGQGELKKRYVIHLFTDAAGGLLPYAKDEEGIPSLTAMPYKDSQYILDKSQMLMTGKDEYAEVYDYRDAALTENYELLETKPHDWKRNYTSYYERAEDTEEGGEEEGSDNYQEIEQNIQDVYTLTEEMPYDWNTNYWSYYTQTTDPETGEFEYVEVEKDETELYRPVTVSSRNWKKKYSKYYYNDGNEYKKVEKVPKYTRIKKRPKDWTKKYSNYYTRSGQNVYSTVSGDSKTKYVLQTVKPSVWATNWKNYYIKRKVHGKVKYVQIKDDSTLSRRKSAPKWKKKTYYDTSTYTVAPKWSSSTLYYSKSMVVPSFSSFSQLYEKREVIHIIEWQANTYYSKAEDVDVGVEFVPNSYYRQVLDHYADLVAGGIEMLEELNNTDSMELSLKEDDLVYDIGDTIGGAEVISGLYMAQPVTKKIVKIENNVVDITYESKEASEYGS